MQYNEPQGVSIGFALRVTRLGHVVRGGAPGAADRVLATRLGDAAVGCLARGESGVLVGTLRGEIASTPLAEIAGRTRPAKAELLELARVMAM
jgi:6-phosphofructokinase 1